MVILKEWAAGVYDVSQGRFAGGAKEMELHYWLQNLEEIFDWHSRLPNNLPQRIHR